MKKIYECETCGKGFLTEEACRKHEKEHSEVPKELPKNVIKCPTCNGYGKEYDGICDYPVLTCHTCKGKKFVKAIEKTYTVLEPIDD